MIVDASALVAILAGEPDARELSFRLDEAALRLTHPVSVYEATVAIARLVPGGLMEAETDLRSFFREGGVGIVPIDDATAMAAFAAFARYGKGRHPAALNMGDCFSYAVARLRGLPLLYKGEGFAQTDLA